MEGEENRFRFTGRDWDGDAGNQFNRWRYYRPDVGRWTALDPLSLGDAGSSGALEYYYRHRWYDPAMAQFNRLGPIGFEAGINQYLYVMANPISSVDPEGLETFQEYYLSCWETYLVNCFTAMGLATWGVWYKGGCLKPVWMLIGADVCLVTNAICVGECMLRFNGPRDPPGAPSSNGPQGGP